MKQLTCTVYGGVARHTKMCMSVFHSYLNEKKKIYNQFLNEFLTA